MSPRTSGRWKRGAPRVPCNRGLAGHRVPGIERRHPRARVRARGRAGAAAARPLRPRALRRTLRRARHPGRRGPLLVLHHVGHERRADRRDGPAPAHARDARRDAAVTRAAPDPRHHRRPALPRLVAARAPVDALVPRRADRVARASHRRAVSDREGRRLQPRRREADRAPGRTRGDRDRERAPARAQPRAVDHRGAQPARARASRQRHPAAVRRGPGGGVRLDAARARPRRRGRRDGARRRARTRRDGGAARGRVRAAAGLAGGGRARDGAAQARRCVEARVRAADRAARRRGAQAGARPGHAGAADRTGGARQRAASRGGFADRRAAGARLRRARAVRERRWLRVRSGGGARAAARADIDGRAGDGARRDALGELLGRGYDRAPRGPSVIRVVLADDHAVVRQGLRTFLDLQDDIEVVAEASDGAEAVEAAASFDPDVVLLDLVMPGLDGLGALKRLREGRARIIVLTSFGDDDKLFAALRGGAAGYLLKDVQPADLVRAIRSAHAGESPLSPAIATRVVEEVAQGAVSAHDDLTPRELDVLTLIARGRSNKVIARELGVAEKTVKTHVSHILAKLGVSDRTQAALYAVKQGL